VGSYLVDTLVDAQRGSTRPRWAKNPLEVPSPTCSSPPDLHGECLCLCLKPLKCFLGGLKEQAKLPLLEPAQG
jgi:hypothetical protein